MNGCDFWIPAMNETVGKEGTVTEVYDDDWEYKDVSIFVEFENGLAFDYPPAVVELV